MLVSTPPWHMKARHAISGFARAKKRRSCRRSPWLAKSLRDVDLFLGERCLWVRRVTQSPSRGGVLVVPSLIMAVRKLSRCETRGLPSNCGYSTRWQTECELGPNSLRLDASNFALLVGAGGAVTPT